MDKKSKLPRGGNGGSAEVTGDGWIVVGGNGGRGGSVGGANGGNSGEIIVNSSIVKIGYIRGGDGGDAGRPARPALGAASSLCYMRDLSNFPLSCVDIYGIPQPGKGGDSFFANITHKGKVYSLNIILRLIDGPVPNILGNNSIIDEVDCYGLKKCIKHPQEWWNLALELFPLEMEKIISYMEIRQNSHIAR